MTLLKIIRSATFYRGFALPSEGFYLEANFCEKKLVLLKFSPKKIKEKQLIPVL